MVTSVVMADLRWALLNAGWLVGTTVEITGAFIIQHFRRGTTRRNISLAKEDFIPYPVLSTMLC